MIESSSAFSGTIFQSFSVAGYIRCTNPLKIMQIAKTAKSKHILDLFSALDDLIELIPFALFKAQV
jgi:hypothetical protein